MNENEFRVVTDHFEMEEYIMFLPIRLQSVHTLHQLLIGIQKLRLGDDEWSARTGIPFERERERSDYCERRGVIGRTPKLIKLQIQSSPRWTFALVLVSTVAML